MLNNVILQGRVASEIDLKTTTTGKSVLFFNLAVERDFETSGKRETDFIPVVLWGKTAEFASRYFFKGKMMIVRGNIQMRSYTDKTGYKRNAFEVVAEEVHFAGDKAKSTDAPGRPGDTSNYQEIADDEDLPF